MFIAKVRKHNSTKRNTDNKPTTNNQSSYSEAITLQAATQKKRTN